MGSQQKNSEKLRIFSIRLKSRMARLGLQSNEVANKIGVSPAAMSNWMKGVNAAKGKNLRKLAQALDSDAHWLSGDQGEEPEVLKEDFPQAEIRQNCHRHVDRVLDACNGDRNKMTWTLVEMERRFPVPPPVSLEDKKAALGLVKAAGKLTDDDSVSGHATGGQHSPGGRQHSPSSERSTHQSKPVKPAQ